MSLSSFSVIPVSDVVTGIMKLPDKSSAADPLPVPVLKQVAIDIAPFLTELFNWSLAGCWALSAGVQRGVCHGCELQKNLKIYHKIILSSIIIDHNENLTFSDQVSFSSLSKSCYSDIHELRYIRPYLDSKTASTIDASIVHFKLEYCNAL